MKPNSIMGARLKPAPAGEDPTRGQQRKVETATRRGRIPRLNNSHGLRRANGARYHVETMEQHGRKWGDLTNEVDPEKREKRKRTPWVPSNDSLRRAEQAGR
eukprot:scaffold2502_cov440-Ochromonas_danica.AAC.1